MLRRREFRADSPGSFGNKLKHNKELRNERRNKFTSGGEHP
jgi:hypothetical protein